MKTIKFIFLRNWNNKNSILCYLLGIIFSTTICSCVTLKPYEKIYVNDPEMQLGNDANKNFQDYTHAIREGATPANSGKSSGGCGCN